jgi:hypothetical protein
MRSSVGHMPDDAKIVDGPIEVASDESNKRAFSYRVMRGEAAHDVLVVIPTAMMASSPLHPLGALVVETKGRSALSNARSPKAISPNGLHSAI